MAPARLELALTESDAADDSDAAIAMMNRLRLCGVRMSIDDFGTGYSSLSYLKRLKVYKLKNDQSFARGIAGDADDRAIVSAIDSMARILGLRTMAEGVETAEQVDCPRQAGCDEIPGYWLSRRLPPAPFEALLRQWATATTTSSVRHPTDGTTHLIQARHSMTTHYLASPESTTSAGMAADGLHPSRVGYPVWAGRWPEPADPRFTGDVFRWSGAPIGRM